MQDLALKINGRVKHNFVAFFFRFSKNYASVALAACIAKDDVTDRSVTFKVVAADREVLNV